MSSDSIPPLLGIANRDIDVLRVITDCLHEAVCVIDAEERVVVWNRSSEKLYAVEREQILRRRITDFFPDSLIARVGRNRQASHNVHHSPRAGQHILASAEPLYMNGVFLGAVSSDRDYAEVTRLYQELEDAKSRVQFLEGEIQRFSGSFGRLVGTNHVLQKRVDTARQVAPSGASVLLTGESGTGKEAFARGIHESSGRKGMFVPVNCSAVPAELFEAEFFGYAGGAFTGANRRGKLGFFELANDGTLFLDEIGEMPPAIQAKLLRVLQEREFIRVGGEEIVRVDVRIVSATNRSLEDMLEKGMFRKDLYYRLNVVEINLPPLRERLDDLPVLVEHFVAAFSQGNAKTPKIMSQEAMAMLRRYLWPGNIRELMNVLENLVVTCPGEVIESRHVPENISRHLALEVTGPSLDSDSPSLDLKLAIQERESQIIQAALRLADHNKSRAALLLNIPRASLYNKISAYGLQP